MGVQTADAESADLVFDPDVDPDLDGTTTGLSVFVGNIRHEVVITLNHDNGAIRYFLSHRRCVQLS